MKQVVIDLRQSKEWGKFLEHLGWEVKEVQSSGIRCQILIRKIPLFGSVIKIQRPPEPIDFREIDKISRKHRALFVKLEPWVFRRPELDSGSWPSELSQPSRFRNKFGMTERGFKKDSWPLLPTRTIWIDLAKSEDKLLKGMKKDARYCIRRAGRNNLSISVHRLSEENTQLKEFYNLLKETGRRGKFWVPPFKHLEAKAGAFESKGWLVLARLSGEKAMLAGAMILPHKEAAFYHHAASNKEGQRLLAPYAVMWEALKLAKRQGCKVLDLEGIYDPRYPKLTKKWKGFTHFKKGFGGEIVEFPGSYTKHYNPFTRILFGSF